MQVAGREFAFGFDIGGMQTLFGQCQCDVELGLVPFPCRRGSARNFRGAEWEAQGRMVRYDVPRRSRGRCDWMNCAAQRINLGAHRAGVDKGRRLAGFGIGDLTDPVRQLDLWTGTATSRYSIDGREVVVTTVGHREGRVAEDRVGKKVSDGTVGISLQFPFPQNTEFGSAPNWDSGRHLTELSPGTYGQLPGSSTI